MSITTPSDTIPEIVPDNMLLPPMGEPEIYKDGRLTRGRWCHILSLLMEINDPNQKLFTLRQFCDGYGLSYNAMFAVIATYGPGLL